MAAAPSAPSFEELDLEATEVLIPSIEAPCTLSLVHVKEPAMVSTVAKGTNTLWANVWAASVVGSGIIRDWLRKIDVGPCSVLELACGTGLVSLVAHRHGCHALATDVSALALAAVEHNASLISEPAGSLATQVLSLETAPEEAYASLPSAFQTPRLVVVADILYLSCWSEPLAKHLTRLLSPGEDQVGVVVDAGRAAADAFPGHCERHGLECITVERDDVQWSTECKLPTCRVFVVFRAKSPRVDELAACSSALLEHLVSDAPLKVSYCF
jgi:predicted nicotinamide N-methyase